MSQPTPRSLPALAWAGIFGGVLLALLIVALLAVQLAVLTDSRKHIRSQDAKVTALYNGAQPAVRQVRPLVRDAAPLLLSARSALRSLRGTGTAVSDAATAFPRLVRAGEALASEGIPLIRGLEAAGAPRLVGEAQVLLDGLLARNRLLGVLDQASALLDQIRAEDLVTQASRSARLAPVLVHLQRRLLRVQKVTLAVQRNSRNIQEKTLAIQREALAHIESIDRKTGGQLPPAPVAAPRR